MRIINHTLIVLLCSVLSIAASTKNESALVSTIPALIQRGGNVDHIKIELSTPAEKHHVVSILEDRIIAQICAPIAQAINNKDYRLTSQWHSPDSVLKVTFYKEKKALLILEGVGGSMYWARIGEAAVLMHSEKVDLALTGPLLIYMLQKQ